jgi:hypothetical protein
VEPPDFLNVFRTEVWLWEFAAYGEPSLGNAVRHILGVSSKEQMIWPNARRIVAVVADFHSGGWFAVKLRVGDDVSFPRSPVHR